MDDGKEWPDTGDDWWAGWKQAFAISWDSLKRLSWPPSRCPHCGHQIRWFENIPVVSWLALRGKCSSCKKPISPRYILVELLTGILFVCCFARFGLGLEMLSAWAFLLFLIPLVFIDAELWILPFELTIPGLFAGIGLAAAQDEFVLRQSLLGAAAGFLTFRVMEFAGFFFTGRRQLVNGVMRFCGREALGMGDKYLLAMIGAYLGWRALLGVILFSSLQGSVVGIIRIRQSRTAEPEPPDAPVEEESTDDDDDGFERHPFSPSFLRPGLPLWKRIVLVPVTILFQDIPDSPPPDPDTGDQPEWVPGPTNIPFGPWLGLAGIEVMLLGPWLVEQLAHTPFRLIAEIAFGQ